MLRQAREFPEASSSDLPEEIKRNEGRPSTPAGMVTAGNSCDDPNPNPKPDLTIIPVSDAANNDKVVDALAPRTAELVVRGAADAVDAT